MDQLLKDFLAGDRKALSKCITILESENENDWLKSEQYLEFFSTLNKNSIRIAISGPPGVGKSTFINALGFELLKRNKKIAILAVDPSSELSRGSILGDKVRMTNLLGNENVYIRPSPSKLFIGGLSLATFDVILAMQAFGFDVIIIETVGVGQSESLAFSISDHFVLLMQPGAGDDLQAMKKGNFELADFILVNKADLEQEKLAKIAINYLSNFFSLTYNPKIPCIFLVSAKTGLNINEFLSALLKRHEELCKLGKITELRKSRISKFFDHVFERTLVKKAKKTVGYKENMESILSSVAKQNISLRLGIKKLIDKIFNI